jgi:fumarylacetoacetate (FAA) hydrolase
MKLATYQDGSRDGQLIVVSRDLRSAHFATGIATRMQQLLDDWNFVSPQLEALYRQLNQGKARHAFAFDARLCMAPVPRASAHLALTPSLERCASDGLLAPRAALPDAALEHQPGLALLTGDIAAGTGADGALEGVRLLMLADALRRPGADAHDAMAWHQAQSGTCFGPVAATTDEFDSPWPATLSALTLRLCAGDAPAVDLALADFSLSQLGERLAALAHTRPLHAGTLVRLSTGVAPAMPGAPVRIELRDNDVLGRIELARA